ncbi:MAG: TrmB family transcriptional regulator [Candidatus Eisenbacteria sp.]|nr:TrmB family transcriptional regulator [Candidatus Eisenbacteria bacterium]
MTGERLIEPFVNLGFTRVEAEVYLHLLTHSPATGYAIAQAINRTKGAVYKVLSSLEAKGAIVVDDSASRQCRAIPPGELLERLERTFQREKLLALKATRKLQPAPSDERIYQLATVDQVYGRAREMLAVCQKLAMLDLFPGPYAELRESLRDAIGRGVRIAVLLYEQESIPGAWTSVSTVAQEVLEYFPVRFLYVCTDASQQLIAAIAPEGDRVLHASWTENPLLSWAFSSYVARTARTQRYEQLLNSGASLEDMHAAYAHGREFMPMFISPGYKVLAERFGFEEKGTKAGTSD